VNPLVDIALRLLPVIGLVIPAVAIIVAYTGRPKEEYQPKAFLAALVSFFLVVVTLIIAILFIVYYWLTLEWISGFFLASLVALIASVVILIRGYWQRFRKAKPKIE